MQVQRNRITTYDIVNLSEEERTLLMAICQNPSWVMLVDPRAQQFISEKSMGYILDNKARDLLERVFRQLTDPAEPATYPPGVSLPPPSSATEEPVQW